MEYPRLVRLLVVNPQLALVTLCEHPRRVTFAVVTLLLHSFVIATIALILTTWTVTLAGMHGAALWWVVFVLISIWIVALIVLSVCVAQDLRLVPGLLTALAGLVPSLALSMTYIR